MRLVAQFAPDAVLLAAVTALARLCLTQGHRTRGQAAHRHQEPHNRPVGTDRHEHDANEGDDMDRIYMNRLPGQERIHIEIAANEVADLLDDLPAENPEWFEATKQLRAILAQASADFGQTHHTRQVLGTTTEQPETKAAPVDLKQPAYDAVFAYIRSQPRDFLPATVVDRNAIIWHAVHAALNAVLPAPADRAAILREAEAKAREIVANLWGDGTTQAQLDGAGGARAVEWEIGRLAAEAQQPAPAVTEETEPMLTASQFTTGLLHTLNNPTADDELEAEVQRERPTPFECEPGNRCNACAVCWS